MIQPRTLIAAATAGIGTLVGGAMAGSQPDEPYGAAPSTMRLAALGPALGGAFTGVMLAITGPGRSMQPLFGTLGAATGGLLIGQQLLGPLLRRRE